MKQKADAEQITQALITAYATDAFNAYYQFVTQHLRPDETVNEFSAELWRLARLVGRPLPECWLTCTFVPGLPQHVKHLLRASSRMEMMRVEQLLTQARAAMTDNEGPAELAAVSARWTPSESKVHCDDGKFACYRCGGPNHMAKNCLQDRQERSDSWMCKIRCEIHCFRCSGLGHIALQFQGNAKRGGGIRISLLPDRLNTKKLPSMKVHVHGQECTALIDSGCSQTLVSKAICHFWKWKSAGVLTADGRTLNCWGYSKIKVEVGQVPAVDIEALVVDKQLLGFNLLLRIDAIKELGVVYLMESGEAHFGGLNISIDEPDFSVTSDCSNKEWTASWKWTNSHSPSKLSNSVQEYAVPCHSRDAYENEILQWQQNGWLLPYSEELGPPKSLILLMVVVQEQKQKQKVRSVLDYWELNGFVDFFTVNAEVCTQKLREWQRQGVNVSLLDLQNAYLQIHIDKVLWPFQAVIFRGQRFCLTQLGFGLNVAPLIMKSVIDAIVSQDHTIKKCHISICWWHFN